MGESIVASLNAAAKRHGVALAYRNGEIHVGGRHTNVAAFKTEFGDVIAGFEALVNDAPQRVEAEAAAEQAIITEWTCAADGAAEFMDRVTGGPSQRPAPVQRVEPPRQPPAWAELPPAPTYAGYEVATEMFFRWLARRRVAAQHGEEFAELPPHQIPLGWWIG